MLTIHLNNLIFFSFHGMHEEEKILGNTFEVNVALTIDIDEKITSLDQTINYASVYDLIKQRMKIAAPLLETLVQDMAHDIHQFDLRIKKISINIQKKYPPITAMRGSVAVSVIKEF